MKKTIIFMVLVFFVLSYAGCAKRQTTKNEGSAPDQNVSMIKQDGQQSADQRTTKQMNGNEQAASDKKRMANEQAAEAARKAVARTAESGKEIADLKDIHFDFDQYKIQPEDRQVLANHADFLLKNKNVKLVIEGNCDERGTAEYNLALGERRAKEAKNYLVNLGVGTKRIKTISYGKERPLEPAHNEEAWAKNRRDHFIAN